MSINLHPSSSVYPLTSFYDIFYILELFVDWALDNVTAGYWTNQQLCKPLKYYLFIHLFKPFVKSVNVSFVSEEMVWQTVPVFDDSQKEGVLKRVNVS